MPSVIKRIRVGVLWGAAFACAYSLYVLVLVLVRGFGPLDRHGVTLAQVLLVYWAGGITAGVIVGLLLPIGRWLPGAMLIGSIAAIPVFGGIQWTDTPLGAWARSDVVEVLILSCAFGCVCGAMVWRENRQTN